MAWFKCYIAGENFPGAIIGEDNLVGFYTTRYAEASSSAEAEIVALAILRQDQSMKLPEGAVPSHEARVYFEKVEEVEVDEVPKSQGQGFTFYRMGT